MCVAVCVLQCVCCGVAVCVVECNMLQCVCVCCSCAFSGLLERERARGFREREMSKVMSEEDALVWL